MRFVTCTHEMVKKCSFTNLQEHMPIQHIRSRIHIYMCVCVCLCMRARARACVCTCAREWM